jgi:hypothetical protein
MWAYYAYHTPYAYAAAHISNQKVWANQRNQIMQTAALMVAHSLVACLASVNMFGDHVNMLKRSVNSFKPDTKKGNPTHIYLVAEKHHNDPKHEVDK